MINKKAFTLVELLVVIAIIAAVSLVVLPNFFARRNITDLNNTTTQIVALLRQAQADSMSQKQGMTWGVHFQNATATGLSYALFSSTSTVYNPSSISGYYQLPKTIGYFSVNPVPSGLSGWWPLDEGVGSTTADYSGNNATGSWNGGLINGTHYSSSRIGPYAGNFNGTDNYVSSSIASVPSVFTITAWIRLSELGREQHFAEFTGTQFYVSGGNKLGTASWSNAVGSTTLTTNVWYFATLVRDGSVVTLYLNGQQDGSAGSLGINPSSPFIIGDLYSHTGSYKFHGAIDDVRVYNRVLSPAEISQIYNSSVDVAFDQLSGAASASTTISLYVLSQPSTRSTISVASSGVVSF